MGNISNLPSSQSDAERKNDLLPDHKPSRRYTKKIALVGNSGVGKKTLAKMVAYSPVDDSLLNTVGTKISKYGVRFNYPDIKVSINIIMWDLPGRPEFESMLARYVVGIEGLVVVTDLTSKNSIDRAAVWVSKVFEAIRKEVPVVFIGNKSDIATQEQIAYGRTILERLSSTYKGDFFISSAVAEINVREPFFILGKHICQNQMKKEAQEAKDRRTGKNGQK
ncbi:MAG: GTP-binding protein [Thermoplasmata archaeon]